MLRGKGKNGLQGNCEQGSALAEDLPNTCFSVGCSGYYKKTPTRYVCCEARHLNVCFSASSSLLFRTQILQLLCVGYMS